MDALKTDHHRLLIRFYGMVDALYWLPSSGRCNSSNWCRVERWAAAYRTTGLRIASDRNEAILARDLVAAGWLSGSGETQAKGYQLTDAGVMQAVWQMGEDFSVPVELLFKIEALTDEWGTGRDYWKDHFWGWRLIEETAGEDYSKVFGNQKRWTAFLEALGKLDSDMAPLLILGWAHRVTNATGWMQMFRITDKGRDALRRLPGIAETWEGVEAPDQDLSFYPDWKAGWEAGQRQFIDKPEPPSTRNLVPHRLPDSFWFDRKEAVKGHKKQAAKAGKK